MTTVAAPKKKSSPKSPKKPLRIRPELLPDSAKYCTFDEREYVMIPVEDFGGWLEDIEDCAVAEYIQDDPTPGIPFEEMMRRLKRKGGK